MTAAGPEKKSLGRYELLYMLGQGGMGEVHLAKLTGAAGFEKLCIVKTILPQMQADPQFLERFHHEARVLVQLTHANIAQVYDMGDVDRTLYMAIEYVPGVDLSRVEGRVVEASSAMPLPVALHIGRAMCEALGYAHRKAGADGAPMGIVHRDVSPQNVMVSYEGEVKVIDFGLAKSSARSKHTLPQTVLGKLGYMSPEQAMAKSLDHRSDIYSAGIVIWEMLAGRPLFNGATMAEMLVQMANPTIPPLTEVRPEVSPALDAIVARALAKDPSARYNRSDDFARALNELAVREGLTTGAEEVGNYLRAMCPEEFAAERKLQSQLSMLRRKGSVQQPEMAPPNSNAKPRSGTTSAVMAGTVVRSGEASLEMTPAQRALSVLEPADSALDPTPTAPTPLRAAARAGSGPSQPAPSFIDDEIVVPKSKAPMVVLGIVIVFLIAGAAVLLKPSSSPSEPAAPMVQVPDVKPLGTAPNLPPVAAATKPSVQPLPIIEVPAATPMFKVRGEGGRTYILLEKGQRLKEGDRVSLIGEAMPGSKHEVYGSGAVLELKGSIATLILDDDRLSEAKGRLVAIQQLQPTTVRTPKERPKTEPVVAAATKLPQPEPLKPVVVEPVVERPKPVVAEKHIEPVKADPEPGLKRAEPAPAPAARARFEGELQIRKDLYGGSVTLKNKSTFRVSNCNIRLPTKMVYQMRGGRFIDPNGAEEVQYADFKPDSKSLDENQKKGWGLVECSEGIGYVTVKTFGG